LFLQEREGLTTAGGGDWCRFPRGEPFLFRADGEDG